jgi:hypothetical protein
LQPIHTYLLLQIIVINNYTESNELLHYCKMSAQISALLEKMTASDKDFRYMAANDLKNELDKDTMTIDDELSKRVCLHFPFASSCMFHLIIADCGHIIEIIG